MNIVIVGQGAIGLLCYAHLVKSEPLRLSLLASPSFNERQFTFTNIDGKDETIAITLANKETLKQADLVIYCVKAYQLNDALAAHQAYIGKTAVIALAHNGMSSLTELPEAIQKQPILAMLFTHGSKKLAKDHIVHTGVGQVDIGCVNNTVDIDFKQQLMQLFNQYFAEIFWHQDIKAKQWLKLAINCVINPLTAIYDVENGAITSGQFTAVTHTLLQEIVEVAKHQQVSLDLAELESTVQKVAKATARNCSSMRADILANKKTEIDYINGYVDKLGKLYQVNTPENSRLWQAVNKLSGKR
ncbi:ketopantoate reductase family protein [Thalassotalea sp. PLHSN55]|uniref:ketopantoate reductase family protein n=1 Tax=Thalassotalea sp. PLHSN55 TaxID=3435888 RepID=UPI003F86BE24